MKKLPIILIFCCNYALCQVREDKEIVIMFQKKPQFDAITKFPNGAILTRVAFITLFYDRDEERIELKSNTTPSTIILKPKSSHVILRHYHNYFDFNDYLLKRGDTILIDYSSKIPRIQNTKSPPAEYEVENIIRSSFSPKGFDPIGKYFEPMVLLGQKLLADKKMLSESAKLTPKQILERNSKEQILIKKELSSELEAYLSRYNVVLDSLIRSNQISKESFQLYQRKAMIINDLLNLEINQIPESQVKEILLKYDVFEDSFEDIYYRNLLVSFVDKYIAQKATYMDLKDGRNRDSREIYRLIKESSLMTSRAKETMLTREINRLNAYYSKQDFKEYFQYYERDINNENLVATMRERYITTLEENISSEEVWLVTLNKQKLSLSKLVENNKDKIIYVDFWASWFSPCRAAMPESTKLRKELKDKDIVFVYLSIDKVFDAWKKAADKEGLTNYSNSFLISNTDANEFLKQHKVTSIPRYMIFDKNGKLAHTNAPRVESVEAKALLLKLADNTLSK